MKAMPSMRCRRSIAVVCDKDSPAPLDAGHAFAIDGEWRSEGVLNRESGIGVWGSIYGLAVLALIQPKGFLPSGNAQWNHEVDQLKKSVTPAKTEGGYANQGSQVP